MFFGKPPRNHPWTALVLPYEFGPDGDSIGPQTILRLERLVEEKERYNRNISNVVLTAGLAPKPIRSSRPKRTFSVMMNHWLVLNGAFDFSQIHTSDNPNVWTSIGESLEAMRLIEEYDLSKNILVVSTHNHVYPRLWIMWFILLAFKPGWHVDFATTRACKVGMVHELLGTVKYIFMAFAWRIKAN